MKVNAGQRLPKTEVSFLREDFSFFAISKNSMAFSNGEGSEKVCIWGKEDTRSGVLRVSSAA
ncbi:MAG: hypothetical protein FJX03_05120 [Alphaproteobacteria bacterium]|nr:hypothetical protein [Alphaproteobacteria bacterium]